MFPFSRIRHIVPFFYNLSSPAVRRRVVELLPLKTVQRAREISDTIDRCSREIFEAKKLALQQGDETVIRQTGEGKDIMSKLREYTRDKLQ